MVYSTVSCYASGLVVLVFVPIGFAWALPNATFECRFDPSMSKALPGGRSWPFALAPVVSMFILFLVPGAAAALQADLGAVSQTKAELSVYSWPAWPIQDELRRSSEIDLRQAIEQYRSALALDPYNVTAHRRLGQITCHRATTGLRKTIWSLPIWWLQINGQTRQLLGEAYAVTGELERARQLWQTTDEWSRRVGAAALVV